MTLQRFTLAAIAVLAAASASESFALPAQQRNGLLADAGGKTLYVFTEDAYRLSRCKADCAKAWPPFLVAEADDAAEASPDYSIFRRDDGKRQWAYKGQPLYFFAGDAAPGDVKGDQVAGAWFVVRTGQPSRASASAPDYAF